LVERKDAAMKELTLLLLLMMAIGLGWEGATFQNQAAAASAPREAVDARPASEYFTEHQINLRDEKNYSNATKWLSADPTDEVEAKRLKLLFLLMMSLGPYRAPVH
jgi:hypothetical protein